MTSSATSPMTSGATTPTNSLVCHVGQQHGGNQVVRSELLTVLNKGGTQVPVGPAGGVERETWNKKIEFLLAVIGFAVDLGNVVRFPYICYKNGGGAFLVPYVVMLVLGGLPIFYLELALGQFYRNGCLTVWTKVCPIMKGVGYAICIIDLYMAMYYNTLISYAIYYLVASLRSELPWKGCGNPWNTPRCVQVMAPTANNASRLLTGHHDTNSTSPAEEFFERYVLQIHESRGLEQLGPIKWSLALCLLAVFLLVYFSLWKGVRSAGKAVWITAIAPYIVLFSLLIRGVNLPGAGDGILYYLRPQWAKLKEIGVWIDAATQIFFSLGPGFGTLLALASYNKFHNNCYRDAILTSSVNCATSFVAGFVIFSVLGYMAHMQNKDIESVANKGIGLIYIVYPEAIATMEWPSFWSVAFFFMLVTLGLDSTFGGLEAMITGLCDEYPTLLGRHRELFVGFLLIAIYVCALPTTTYGGSYVVQLLDSYGPSISILFVVFVEAVAVCWLYGTNRFADDITQMIGVRPGIFWRVCWTFISPTFILMIFVFALVGYTDLKVDDYEYPRWAIGLGWLMTASSLACIPAYAAYKLSITPGSLKQRLLRSIRPDETASKEARDEALTLNSAFAV